MHVLYANLTRRGHENDNCINQKPAVTLLFHFCCRIEPQICFASHCHPSLSPSSVALFLFWLCASVFSSSPPLIMYIALDYSFLHFSFSPSPSLCPVLFLSHSFLSPADSTGISVHWDHMTISPIGSPPLPMSSYQLAPFPAKSRPVGAALATLCRPSGWAVCNSAPLLFHTGLDLSLLQAHTPTYIRPCCSLNSGEPIGKFKDFLFTGHPVQSWILSTKSGTSLFFFSYSMLL